MQQKLMILWDRAQISRTGKSKAVHSCRKLSRYQKTNKMADKVCNLAGKEVTQVGERQTFPICINHCKGKKNPCSPCQFPENISCCSAAVKIGYWELSEQRGKNTHLESLWSELACSSLCYRYFVPLYICQ